MVVTIYKNKASGRYFIQTWDISSDEAYFITPPDSDGNVRSINLRYELFHDDPQQEEESVLLSKNYITKEHLQAYNTVIVSRGFETYFNWYNSLSSLEIKKYLKKGGQEAKDIKSIEDLLREGKLNEDY